MSGAHVAVVGAGLSGTAAAIHALREGAARVTMIERAHPPGRGIAYGTDRPEHLLNVTAGRMSLFPDDPGHFARWLEARGGDSDDYAPRRLFGDYSAGLLAASTARVVRGEAVAVEPREGGERVRLAGGGAVDADCVVLALGNLEPATPPGIRPEALGERYVADPWYGGIAEGLGEEETVLLVGTGLTAVDAALTLDSAGFGGRVVALSRRGLSPRPHAARDPGDSAGEMPPADPLRLLRRVRARSWEIGWRSAVHELRPVTQRLWAGADIGQRRRFLRHLRPWWDVHRHRIAPAVARRIEAMQAQGRLRFVAGRLVSTEAREGEAEVHWRPRGGDRIESLAAARIVNCTGPELDIARAGEPLLDSLLQAGRIAPDPCRIGVHVDEACRALDSAGRPSESLCAIGPMTRGAFWESIAVADIAAQAHSVARRIAL